jgi:hypothetical protein
VFLIESRFSVKIEPVKRETTIYLEDDLLKTVRVAAARAGKHDYQVFEEALRAYLGLDLLERANSSLSESDALDLAYDELHRSRG